jgi:hypothetical protein
MSAPDNAPQQLPTEPTRGQGLGGCLVAFLVVMGTVLMLPGICTVIVFGALGGDGGGWSVATMLLTLLVAGGGVWLIAWAARNR